MAARISVIYYSATGNVHMLANAIAEGAAEGGAEVRLRRVAELAPEEAIQQNELWARHRDETRDTVEEATLDDLGWAEGYAFGTPTRSRLHRSAVGEEGGNPYGTAFPSAGGRPTDAVVAAARHQGRRLALYTSVITEAGVRHAVGAG